MQDGEWSREKRPLEAGFAAKKQMKNPAQVRILEEAYQVAPNPSALMKEELARRTGLDYLQVQYWFGNRRYFDKHGLRTNKSWKCLNDFPRVVKPVQMSSEFNRGRNSNMPQTFVHAGPSMVQSHLLPLPEELRQMLMQVVNKLGHPLRADGPILGTEFKPLPFGAFGTPMVNAEQKLASQHCDDKEIERANKESAKEATFLSTLEYVHACNAEAPRVVCEYQLFPLQPSWMQKYEDANQTHFPVYSVKTSKEHEYTSSSFPFKFGASDAIHRPQQGGVKIISPSEEFWNNAPADFEAVNPITGLSNPVCSSDSTRLDDDSAHEMERTQVHPSELPSGNETQQFDLARFSAPAAFAEVNNMNCYQTIQGLRKRDQPCMPCRHCQGYDGYVVMPQKRSKNISVDAHQMHTK